MRRSGDAVHARAAVVDPAHGPRTPGAPRPHPGQSAIADPPAQGLRVRSRAALRRHRGRRHCARHVRPELLPSSEPDHLVRCHLPVAERRRIAAGVLRDLAVVPRCDESDSGTQSPARHRPAHLLPGQVARRHPRGPSARSRRSTGSTSRSTPARRSAWSARAAPARRPRRARSSCSFGPLAARSSSTARTSPSYRRSSWCPSGARRR